MERIIEKVIEADQALAAHRGAEAYYEDGRVNLAGILKIIALLRANDYHDVIESAMKLGTRVSDHTLLLIDQVADVLRRGDNV